MTAQGAASSPVDLLFGGMEKLGPGGDVHTLHVLRLLPEQGFRVIVDAGCGAGRQTMVLARELGTPVPSVRDFALETMKEIDIFRRSEDSYGYVFYVLQRGKRG